MASNLSAMASYLGVTAKHRACKPRFWALATRDDPVSARKSGAPRRETRTVGWRRNNTQALPTGLGPSKPS